jgi:hypothetical protein
VRAPALWSVLQGLLAGSSIKAAVEALRPGCVLETMYHLLGRLSERLDGVRGCLWRRQKAPGSSRRQPVLQTAEHLQAVFAGAACPVSEFQAAFQQAFLS